MTDHTMRAEPPTAAEVRAVAALWSAHAAHVLVTVAGRGQRWCEILQVKVVNETATAVYSDDRKSLDRADGWLMLGPDGPLSWERVAEFVAAMEGGR